MPRCATLSLRCEDITARLENKFGSNNKNTYVCITLNVSLFPKGIFMSMTKREFENNFSESELEHHDLMWQGYDEYLYQQYGYEEPIEDMYAYSVAQELIASRRDENPTDSRPLVLSPLRNDLGANQ
jgi:hypothetical protein